MYLLIERLSSRQIPRLSIYRATCNNPTPKAGGRVLFQHPDIVEVTECKLACHRALREWRRALSKHQRVLSNLRQTTAAPNFAAYLKAALERHQQQTPIREEYIQQAIKEVSHGATASV